MKQKHTNQTLAEAFRNVSKYSQDGKVEVNHWESPSDPFRGRCLDSKIQRAVVDIPSLYEQYGHLADLSKLGFNRETRRILALILTEGELETQRILREDPNKKQEDDYINMSWDGMQRAYDIPFMPCPSLEDIENFF